MKKLRNILLVLLCCIIPFITGCEKKDVEKIDWEEIVLGEKLPAMNKPEGYIFYNSDTLLIAYVEEVSSKEYYQYIEDCKKFGYDIDIEKEEFSFYGFDKDGYKIELSYFDSLKELQIDLTAPREYEEIEWSTKDIAKMIPETNSKIGEIYTDEDNSWDVIISNITKEELEEYINKCKELGFDKNIDTENSTYKAENEEGYRLNIYYMGFNTVEITIGEPLYEVKLTISSKQNLLFNRYDADISIDDEYFDTIEHGKEQIFTAYLTKGRHTITFEKDSDYDVEGNFNFTTDGEDELSLEITCSTRTIKIKEK